MTAARPALAWLKAAVFGLLAVNASVYVATGTTSEALDTAAWFVLLGLFLLETSFGDRLRALHAAAELRAVRLAAGAAVVAAAVGYVLDREWLDATNSALWISVVVLLEIELRLSSSPARQRVFGALTTACYCGLGATALAWMWQGDWFAAYDALLWLAALVVLESDILSGFNDRDLDRRQARA